MNEKREKEIESLEADLPKDHKIEYLHDEWHVTLPGDCNVYSGSTRKQAVIEALIRRAQPLVIRDLVEILRESEWAEGAEDACPWCGAFKPLGPGEAHDDNCRLKDALDRATEENLQHDEQRTKTIDQILGELKANGHECESYRESKAEYGGLTHWCRMCEAMDHLDALAPEGDTKERP